MKISLALCLLAGACLSESAYAEVVHTVDWYYKHSFDRAALLSECRNNPGQLGNTPNCVNAEKADALAATTKNPRVPAPKGTKPMQGSDFDFSYGR